MDAERLLEKVQKRFTLDHVKKDEVETLSVITIEDLDGLISGQVKERTSQLAGEMKQLRTRIAELEKESNNSSGLERAAAEAALEAEARALEDKAAAELRAERAEARVRELEGGAPAAAAASGSADTGALTAAASKRADEAEAKAAQAEAKAKDLEARVATLEGELARARTAATEKPVNTSTSRLERPDLPKAETGAVPRPETKSAATKKPETVRVEAKPAEPAKPAAVTADDHKRARRLIDALLDDLWNDNEAKIKSASAGGTFRVEFAAELEAVKKQVLKRVRPEILAEKDHWEDALKALETRS